MARENQVAVYLWHCPINFPLPPYGITVETKVARLGLMGMMFF